MADQPPGGAKNNSRVWVHDDDALAANPLQIRQERGEIILREDVVDCVFQNDGVKRLVRKRQDSTLDMTQVRRGIAILPNIDKFVQPVDANRVKAPGAQVVHQRAKSASDVKDTPSAYPWRDAIGERGLDETKRTIEPPGHIDRVMGIVRVTRP